MRGTAVPGSKKDEDPAREAATESFESFFQGEYERLIRAVYLLTGSKAEAEDIAQEALARTLERWDRVRVMDSPVGYVYRIALNLNRRRLRHLLPRPLPGSVRADEPEAAEERTDVMRALLALSRTLREPLVLREWLGLDTAEIAELLGIKESSVRSRIHRGKQALMDELGGDYG